MNKTPAKRAAPTPAKPPKAAPAKSRKAPATKPSRASAPAKRGAKPVAKKTTKPAPKPAAKPVARPAGKTSAKAAPPRAAAGKAPAAKATPAPAAKTALKIANAVTRSTPVPTPPAASKAAAAKPAGSRSGSSKAGHGSREVSAPTPAMASASRFADRFAPARPAVRPTFAPATDAPRSAARADPKLANAWKHKAGRDLSEAELMAMPDAEYMNEKQLDFFRGRLQALKDDLLSNAGETTEHLREDTSIVPDPADRATIEEEHALELRTRDRERKLLKKISQSLARIEAGDYGFCDETGEPIGLGRLIARPTATLSLEAQQRREMKQKMFGD